MRNILICGANHEDRIAYATSLSQKILCPDFDEQRCATCTTCRRIQNKSHPNITYIKPDNDSAIKISQVRNIVIDSQKTNYEAGMAIFLITHMNRITKSAANSLLKTMEETGSQKIFIALAPSRASVLPTIASRLAPEHIKPQPIQNLVLKQEICDEIASITRTPADQRLSFSNNFPLERDKLRDRFSNLQEACHMQLRQKSALVTPMLAQKLSLSLQEAQTHLENYANPKLVCENLLLYDWPYSH